MSAGNTFNFDQSARNTQNGNNSQSVLFDVRRTNYTSPQENFTYSGLNKPSVDWDRLVDDVMKEEICKLSQVYQPLSKS